MQPVTYEKLFELFNPSRKPPQGFQEDCDVIEDYLEANGTADRMVIQTKLICGLTGEDPVKVAVLTASSVAFLLGRRYAANYDTATPEPVKAQQTH